MGPGRPGAPPAWGVDSGVHRHECTSAQKLDHLAAYEAAVENGRGGAFLTAERDLDGSGWAVQQISSQA